MKIDEKIRKRNRIMCRSVCLIVIAIDIKDSFDLSNFIVMVESSNDLKISEDCQSSLPMSQSHMSTHSGHRP